MSGDRNSEHVQLSVGSVLGPLIDQRRLLMIMAGIGLLLGVLHAFLSPRVYEACTSILPEQNSSSSILSRASELAVAAGIALPGETDPSLYYSELMTSSYLLDRVLDTESENGKTILEALRFGDDPAEREKATRRIKRNLDITRDTRSRVIRIESRASSRVLAESIVNNLVATLDDFLRSRRSAEADNLHTFLLAEINRAGVNLSAAEDRLMEFRAVNRLIEQSPTLQREQSSLVREVSLNELVVVELRKQMEFQAIFSKDRQPAVIAIGPAKSGVEAVRPVAVQSIAASLLLFLALGCMAIYFRTGILPFLHKELARDRG